MLWSAVGYCVANRVSYVVPNCGVILSFLQNQELIAKMAKAVTKDEFVLAFESRLGEITL